MRRELVLGGVIATGVFTFAVAAWVRSYQVMDEGSMANEDGQVVAVVSYQGAIHHTRAGRSAAQRRWSYDAHDIPEGATWANFYTTPGNVAWRRLCSSATAHATSGWR